MYTAGASELLIVRITDLSSPLAPPPDQDWAEKSFPAVFRCSCIDVATVLYFLPSNSPMPLLTQLTRRLKSLKSYGNCQLRRRLTGDKCRCLTYFTDDCLKKEQPSNSRCHEFNFWALCSRFDGIITVCTTQLVLTHDVFTGLRSLFL